ncbi:MAG TPA: HlyD family efflux transporter periplasmic adaptor subunit [Gammaproteobacteria bacterium]
MSALFRAEALRSRNAAAGEIVLASPVPLRVLAAFGVAVAAALAAFLAFGTYTRHVTLAGQLVPDRGVIAVLAPQAGTVVQSHVQEGSRVERGDVLFVISGERTSALGETHALIDERLAARRESLVTEIDEIRRLERAEAALFAKRARAIEAELARLATAIDVQAAHVALADETARRYAELSAAGFVSEEQLVARREALLDQRARLAGLERERAQLERALADAQSELDNLPLRYARQAAELERAVASIDLERAENEARREVTIVAPVRGVATAIAGRAGQIVEAGAPLASIVPDGSRLRAELEAPSRAIGFVEAGSDVLVRYSAYPYEKFGRHPGHVVTVSRAALPADAVAVGAAGPREPVYRVVVELDEQTIDVYGEPHALRAGMRVEADVKLETRRLYEWVLEPLYAMKVRASGGGGP